jgi:hypothetical protein
MAGLILVEKTTTKRRVIASGTDRSALTVIAQAEYLHRSCLPLELGEPVMIDAETIICIEEGKDDDGRGSSQASR